jgi:NitT/TauT family transport system substrate-binding protein
MSRNVTRATALGLVGAAAFFPSRAPAQELKTLRICGFPADSYSEPYYAIEQGFMKKYGINLEVVTLANAGEIANAVNADAIDIGMDDAIEVANPYIAGMQIAFFGPSATYNSTHTTSRLVTAPQSKITTAKDCEGKTVAVITLASMSANATRDWLKTNGADQTKVRLVELPFSAMVPGLQRGTIDVALLTEPYLSLLKDQVRPLAVPHDSIGKFYYLSSFFAKRDWINNNKALAHAFMQGMYEAAQWANTHNNESAAILAKYSKLQLDQVRGMTRVLFATSFDPTLLQPVLDLGLRHGELKRPVKASEIAIVV